MVKGTFLMALSVLEKVKKSGEVWHLPFTWPEEPKQTDWHPPKCLRWSSIFWRISKKLEEANKFGIKELRNCEFNHSSI
jgi:hypothetical protein